MSDNKTQKSHTVAIIKVIIQTNKQKKQRKKNKRIKTSLEAVTLCYLGPVLK